MDAADDNDDDDQGPMPQAFPVDDITPDFSSGPPDSAEEYLRRVRWEARSIPDVIIASDLDPALFDDHRASIFRDALEQSSIPQVSPHLAPDATWERDFLMYFQDLSQKWSAWKELQQGQQRTDEMQQDLVGRPKANQKAAWKIRCDMGEGKERDVHQVEGVRPTVNVIGAMDQVLIRTVLQYFDSWLQALTSPEKQIQEQEETGAQLQLVQGFRQFLYRRYAKYWLFSLLVSLETPIDAETSASMRSILRLMCKCRNSMDLIEDRTREEIHELNVFISVLGKHF